MGAGGGVGWHEEPPCSPVLTSGSLAARRPQHQLASWSRPLTDTLISSGELIQVRA